MERFKRFLLSSSLYLFDALIVYISIKAAYTVRFYNSIETVWTNFYSSILWYFVASYIFVAYLNGINYINSLISMSIINRLKQSIGTVIYFCGIIFLLSYFFKYTDVSRIYYSVLILIMIFITSIGSIIKLIVVKIAFKIKFIEEKYIMIGVNEKSIELIEKINKVNNYVTGYFNNIKSEDITISKLNFYGMLSYIDESKIKELKKNNFGIIIALPLSYRDEILDIIALCMENKIEAFLIPESLESLEISLKDIVYIDSIPLIKAQPKSTESPAVKLFSQK